jgi:D-alanyl-D-alanine dipeptidase
LTIKNEKGEILDMGTEFDCFENKAHIDKEDELVAQKLLSTEQKKNRELLRGIMTDVGFATIPTEWWHFQKYDKDELPNKGILLDF